MNGHCPRCTKTHHVRIRRGDKIGNHDCPTCGVPLQGVASGRGRGRYLCPIDGYVVTPGQTAVQLDRPMRLIWQPGDFGRWQVTEPSQRDAQRLEHLAGRVLGTGCVVSDHYAPTGTGQRAGTDEPACAWSMPTPREIRRLGWSTSG